MGVQFMLDIATPVRRVRSRDGEARKLSWAASAGACGPSRRGRGAGSINSVSLGSMWDEGAPHQNFTLRCDPASALSTAAGSEPGMDDARRRWRRRSWQEREMSRTGSGCQQRFQTENVGATCHGAVLTHVQRRPFLCPIWHMRIPVPLCNAMHRPALPLLPIQCNRWAELPSGSEVDDVSSNHTIRAAPAPGISQLNGIQRLVQDDRR